MCLRKMLETGKQAAEIVEEKGLRQVFDTGEIKAIIDKVIADNPEQLAAYKAGKENLFGYFVGQAMKATGGKANPGDCQRIVKNQALISGGNQPAEYTDWNSAILGSFGRE